MALVLAFFVAAHPALGADAPMDGTRLHGYCQEAVKEKPENAFRAGYCMAFVDGTLRGWEAAAYVRDASTNYCLPQSATLGQLVRVVAKYLNDNPAALPGRAEILVITAVQKAYPCPPGKKK